MAINLKSEEAKDIKIKMMKFWLKNLVIHQIERVKNLSAYHKYSKEKAIIQHKYDADTEIEKQLFHGTRSTDLISVISCEKSFDMRFSEMECGERSLFPR